MFLEKPKSMYVSSKRQYTTVGWGVQSPRVSIHK